jgi:hypothetical protein
MFTESTMNTTSNINRSIKNPVKNVDIHRETKPESNLSATAENPT